MKHITILLLIIPFSELFGQGLIELPNEFKDNAYSHVKKLTDIGIRTVGSEGESKTVNYLVNYFRDLNLKPVIDTFNFQGYVAKDIALYINNRKINFLQIYFDPYKDSTGFYSDVFIFDPDSGYKSKTIENCSHRTILTKVNAEVYRLNKYKPKAIIILADTVFNNISKDTKTCYLDIQGNVKNLKSYNIYCSINNKSDKEIAIGAHWDSYNGAGADDNASGVSVILELARYFSKQKNKLPVNLKFILFGAEELGEIGSKAFTMRHIADTSSTLYYLNVDI